jgi:nucleotide-binding universal stress UspA family protein
MLYKRQAGNKVQITFSLPARAGDESAVLVGDFNNWDSSQTPMQRTPEGNWEVTLHFEPNREYEYRYLVNGHIWRNDQDADGYARNIYQAYNSLVMTTVWSPQPEADTPATLASSAVPYKRVLLPFTDAGLLEQALARILPTIEVMADELTLLRVRPFPVVAGAMEAERLYTELKSVQAQLQRCAIPVKLDTVVGALARSIVEYARQNSVDLILLPSPEEAPVAHSVWDAVGRRIAQMAPCDTRLIGG